MQAAALPVDRQLIALDDVIRSLRLGAAAATDAAALVQTNQQLEGILEGINEATTRTEIMALYAQVPAAQRSQQAALDRLAADVGLPPSLRLAAITG
jgi:hypothetical protein